MNKYTLEAVEKSVLNYAISIGYKVGEGNWGFQVSVNSTYKDKKLLVIFYNGNTEELLLSERGTTYKKLFKKVIKKVDKLKAEND